MFIIFATRLSSLLNTSNSITALSWSFHYTAQHHDYLDKLSPTTRSALKKKKKNFVITFNHGGPSKTCKGS